jgi:hypothetical protein
MKPGGYAILKAYSASEYVCQLGGMDDGVTWGEVATAEAVDELPES